MRYLTILTFSVLMIASCTKPGTGGKNNLTLLPRHHGKPIPGCIAYIKYNAKEFPGTDVTKYDLVVPGSPQETKIIVEGLKKGQYYIYCTGYDSSISDVVVGGLPHRITEKQGNAELSVPITEGD
jgi:hypothetical protein